MASFQQYSDALLRCLGTYQFIEEGLRFCLVRYHATTLFRLEGYVAYKVPLKAIEDAPGLYGKVRLDAKQAAA